MKFAKSCTYRKFHSFIKTVSQEIMLLTNQDIIIKKLKHLTQERRKRKRKRKWKDLIKIKIKTRSQKIKKQ